MHISELEDPPCNALQCSHFERVFQEFDFSLSRQAWIYDLCQIISLEPIVSSPAQSLSKLISII